MTDLGKWMEQLSGFGPEIEKFKEGLEAMAVEVTAGGNAVRVTVNGLQEVVAIKLDWEELKQEQPEEVEKLLASAVNRGLSQAREMVNRQIAKMTESLDLSKLFGGF